MRRSSGQRLILATGIVLVACLFLGAGAVWFVTSKLNNFDRIDVAVDAAVKGGPENYLLVGSDSRDGISEDDPDAGGFLDGGYGGGGRSDTIMVARVDPAAEKIAVLSIPRDLYVTIAGGDHQDRINTAYAESPQTLVDTVSQTLGIPLNHYVEIDFRGLPERRRRARRRAHVLRPTHARRVDRPRHLRARLRRSSRAPRRWRSAAPATSRCTTAASGSATRPPTSAASPASSCSCAGLSTRPAAWG